MSNCIFIYYYSSIYCFFSGNFSWISWWLQCQSFNSYRYDKNSYSGKKPRHRQTTEIYSYKITQAALTSLESEVGKTFTDLRDVYNTLRGMEKSNNDWFITNTQDGIKPGVTFEHEVKSGATSIEKKRESGNLQGRKRLR